MNKENTKFHYGSIRFGTHKRVEFPYLDDIVKKLEESIKSYLEEYKLPFDPKDVRVKISVVNQKV